MAGGRGWPLCQLLAAIAERQFLIMQAATQIANDSKAAVQTQRVEGFLRLAATTVTALTADGTVYFQKLWIYPGATASAGVINANAAVVHVGNTANQIARVSLTSLGVTANTTDAPSTLVTAVAAGHGFVSGNVVRISGCTDGSYNGEHTVTVVDANTFTYQLADPPALLAAGGTPVAAGLQPVATASAVLPDALQPTDLPLKYELPLGQKQALSSILVKGAINDGVFWRVW